MNSWAPLWENRLFAYAKTKPQISCAVTSQLISASVFATWIPKLHLFTALLAHLSQRLKGELIGYSWSGLHPSVGIVRPSASFTMLKDLLRNRFANLSQILCGASLGRGNDILFAASGSHDQDGRHAIYGKNPSKIFFSRTGRPIFTKLGM